MKNLAAVVTKEAITQALQEASTKQLNLIPSTRFHLIHNGNAFPPKEIVRLAAKKMGIYDLENYRLIGGDSTNKHLQKMKFEIVTHNQWIAKTKPTIEKRVARICWNEKSWVEPSGKSGKSNDKDSHEYKFGTGFLYRQLNLSHEFYRTIQLDIKLLICKR